jgi:glycosyltransferase involved in cell wall biosynthesis
MFPKISVVTANFNGGSFLEQTMHSILNQGYPNLEYIVIDGGSTDHSLDVIRKYEKRLAYWVSEKDSGHANALNKGFSRVTGDILCWLNSDDMYMPWTFSVIAEIFSQHKDVHWIMGRPGVWNEKGELINVSPQLFNKYTFVVSPFKLMQQESVFFTRSLWERAGAKFNEGIKYMIDSELWSRFYLHESLYNVTTSLGGFRNHGLNRSKMFFEQCLAEHSRCQEHVLTSSDLSFRENVSNVQRLYRLKHSRLTRQISFRSIGKYFFKSTIRASQYNVLYYDNGWKKTTEPFDFA